MNSCTHLLALLAAAAALLTKATAQNIPKATTSRQEIVFRPVLAQTRDDGVRSSMKIQPTTGHPGIAHFDRTNGQLIYTRWNGTWWEDLVVDSFTRDPNPDYFYCSLAYDPAGIPCIAFFNRDADNLKFSRLNATGTGFVTSVVDSSDYFGTAGRFCALAFAPNGNAYLSYYHNEKDYLSQGSDELITVTSELRVATRDTSGAWSIATVDSGGDVGQWTSIAVDANSHPSVSYYDATHGDLLLAQSDGSTWTNTVLSSDGNYGTHTALAIVDPYRGFVAYRNEDTGDLRVYGYDRQRDYRSDWTVASNIQCRGISLTTDTDGRAVVSYRDGRNGDLWLSVGKGITWQQSFVDTLASETSIAMSADGLPSLSYNRGQTRGELKYVKFSGWRTESIATTSSHRVGETCLGQKPSGEPLIISFMPYGREIALSERNYSGQWTSEIINQSPEIRSASLGMKPDGRPAVVFVASRFNQFWFGAQLLMTQQSADGSWSVLPVGNSQGYIDEGPPVTFGIAGTSYPSLGFGPNGRPFVSFSETTRPGIGFVEYGSDGFWSQSGLDTGGGDTSHTAIAFGPEGRPVICYIDFTRRHLKFAEFKADGSWASQTIDTSPGIGFNYGRLHGHLSLCYGPSGRPAVAYLTNGGGNLNFAERKNDGTWTTRIIDTNNQMGSTLSLQYGPEGQPRICYHHQDLDETIEDNLLRIGRIRYAERTTEGLWVIETVEEINFYGGAVSLGSTREGRPRISYSAGLSLKFAEKIFSPAPKAIAPFQILGVTRDPQTQAATLSWLDTTGAKYRVDFSPTMAAGSWQTLGDDINALNGMTFFRTVDLFSQSHPSAFFRVVRK
jgi:hypothetical protein